MIDEPAVRMTFGAELRRWRERSGLSLAGLALRVHYSKSHLSKIENGLKPPTVDLARRCDAILGACGSLTNLVPVPPPDAEDPLPQQPDEVWTMSLWPNGRYEFGAGPSGGTLAGVMSWAPAIASSGDDRGGVRSWRLIFDQLRQLGQTIGPSELVPVLAPTTNVLRVMALRVRSDAHRDMLVLASRFAEFTGWMAQEKGDERAALWWTNHAVELAKAGDDDELLAYAYVRRALIALYRHDPIQTVALARKAQERRRYARILGLAAQREAQGHAIAGDELACHRSLDRAAGHLSRASVDSDDGPLLGTTAIVDPVAMSTGWCLHELGRSRQAASVLMAELERVPARAERARARYGTRLALALASVRELEQASAVMEPILDTLPRIDSATIRTDVGSLARTLNRWHKDPTVRGIMPRLHNALHTEVDLPAAARRRMPKRAHPADLVSGSAAT